MRGLGAGLAVTNGRADFSAEVGAPAIRPGPQAAGPALRLPRTAPGGSLRSALRRRKFTFTAVTAGSPSRRVKTGTPRPVPGVPSPPRRRKWLVSHGAMDGI